MRIRFFAPLTLALAPVFASVLAPLPASAESVQYDTAGGWSLFRNSDGGQVYSCHATMKVGGGAALLFEHSPSYTVIGFRSPNSNAESGKTQVQVVFNDDVSTT